MVTVVSVGCERQSQETLTPIVLQTDWYAQTEHGGFYQALADNLYRDARLDVKIVPGGPAHLDILRVVRGEADFGLGRADDVIVAIAEGAPIVIVGAYMQHDPQAIMVHQDSGIERLKDLDGKTIAATPGSGFLKVLRRVCQIDFSVIPMERSIQPFLSDPNYIQQCFLTNEPYMAIREGVYPRVLPISDSGFDPGRVWYTRISFAREHPDTVRAFTDASIRGWQAFMKGPNRRAMNLIAEQNPLMRDEYMAFSLKTMKEHHLVAGRPEENLVVGEIRRERIEMLIEQLEDVGLIAPGFTPDDVYMPDFFADTVAELRRDGSRRH